MTSLTPHSSPLVPRGFVTLFAVLVAGLLLAVGISIYDITSKELIFTTVTRDSELAFYAADTGLECALKWDIRYDGAANYRSGSVFATSTHSLPPTAGVLCNGIDVAATPWSIDHTAGAATTTFTVTFLPQNYCAVVTVAKSGYPSLTSVVSRGYNLCDQTASGRVERALQANY